MIAFLSFVIALVVIWIAYSIGRGLDIVEQDLNSETFYVPAGAASENFQDARGSGLETFAPGNRRAAGTGGSRSAIDDRGSRHRPRTGIRDQHLFYAMMLLYCYSLAESDAVAELGKNAKELGQIEASVLEASGSDWNAILDAKAGIAEVAVYRSAIADGAVVFEQSDLNRVADSGLSPTWQAGDPIALNDEAPRSFRSGLKSLPSLEEVKPAVGPRAA